MRLSESINVRGYWWLPESAEVKLPGTLSISISGELNLEVLGLFKQAMTLEPDVIPIIHGITDGGKPVTLNQCSYKSRNPKFPGIANATLRASLALVGAHISNQEEFEFTSVTFSFEGLDKWLGISGISVANESKTRSTTISYNPPTTRSYTLAQGIDLAVIFTATVPAGVGNVTEATIAQKAAIQLRAGKPNSFEYFIGYVFCLNNLMCLAFDEAVALTSISFSSEIFVEKIGNKERPIQIEAYYPSLPNVDRMPKLNANNLLFNYTILAESLDLIVSAWLEIYEQLTPALNLYFASTTAEHSYLDSRFLFLVQGLEVLHRRTSSDTVMPSEAFADIVSTLTEACPEDNKKWLENKLTYANEPSLRQRLKALMKRFSSNFGSSAERKSLVSSVVNTRNYMTHYDETLESDAKTGRDLWVLCMRLEALFELWLLKLTKFSDEQIENIAKGNYRIAQKLKHDL